MINTFEDKQSKIISRDLLLRNIKNNFIDRNAVINGFTLPGTAFDLEENIIKEFPESTIKCVEFDQTNYLKGLDIINAKNIDPNVMLYNTSDLKYFKHRIKHNNAKELFDYVWLDYCGTYSKDKEEALELLFKNKMFNFSNGTPILSTTLSAKREQDNIFDSVTDFLLDAKLPIKYKINTKNARQWCRLVGRNMQISEIARRHGYSLEALPTLYYKDKTVSNYSMPMVVFTWNIVKNITKKRKEFIPPLIINIDVGNNII